MRQAILSNLLFPCWFQFCSLHHAESMGQANLFYLLVTHWQQQYSKPYHCIEHHLAYLHCYPTCSTGWPLDLRPHPFLPKCHLAQQFGWPETPQQPLRTEIVIRTCCPKIWPFQPHHHPETHQTDHQIPLPCSQFTFFISTSYSLTGFKPPRMEIPKCSGKNYDFYNWLAACSRNFETTQCPEGARNQMMLQAMTLDKTPQFNNITNWDSFKKKFYLWIWKHSNRCVQSICYLQPLTCLRIHPRTC